MMMKTLTDHEADEFDHGDRGDARLSPLCALHEERAGPAVSETRVEKA